MAFQLRFLYSRAESFSYAGSDPPASESEKEWEGW